MLFSVTDKNFKRICTLGKAINIQWDQKWYSCGQFSIQLPASVNATDDWHYVFCDERQNVGIIQQKIYSQNIKGKFLQISGFFMEHELSNVVIEHYQLERRTELSYASDSLYRRIGFMIQKFILEKDSRFIYDDTNITNTFGKYTNSASQSFDFEINNQDVMSAAFELSKTNETSFIYTAKPEENSFKILKMLPSVENTKVVFTENQLENFTVTYDESNYKNCVKVLGPTFNGEQINLDYKSERVTEYGETERWILLDNTGMLPVKTVNDGKITHEENITDKSEILDMLESNARAELEKYENVVNLDVKIANTGKYVYTKNFNLGDIVTVRIESLNIEETRQIIGVSEVWKANKHEVYIELGESRQSNIDKAKRAVSQGSISKITNSTVYEAKAAQIMVTPGVCNDDNSRANHNVTVSGNFENTRYIELFTPNGTLAMSATVDPKTNKTTSVASFQGYVQTITSDTLQFYVGYSNLNGKWYYVAYKY